MKSSIIFLLSVLSLIVWILGCSTAHKISLIDSDEAMVKQCKFVGSYVGEGRALGLDFAKQKVQKEASAKGATHIIWGNVNVVNNGVAGSSTYVQGKAYACPPKP